MTDSHKIHHSFKDVATLQSYGIDHLIAAAEGRKQDFSNRLEDAKTRFANLLSADKNDGLSLIHYCSWDVRFIAKTYVDSHNVELILRSMKSNGVERLELDTSQDMYEQILTLAYKKPENLPAGLRVAVTKAWDDKNSRKTFYFLDPGQQTLAHQPRKAGDSSLPRPAAS